MSKKHFLVVPRAPNVMKNGLDIGGKHISFHGKSAKMITDSGIADAIDQKYGTKAQGEGRGDVWVERDERANNTMNYHDGVHKYFFGSTRAFASGWERIFGK